MYLDNINYNRFSARPEERLCLYDEHILNDELLNIIHRIKIFVDKLKLFKIPISSQQIIKENDDTYYYEQQKMPIRTIGNYFLDIKVNSLVNILRNK